MILLIIAAANAEDVTKVLQNGLNGYDGCVDSYLYRSGLDSSTYTQNFGNEEYLITANWPNWGQIKARAVIKFDLSTEIPPDADIKNALLSIFFSTGTEGDTITTAYRLIKEWDELGASWMNAAEDIPWTNVGGDYTAEDSTNTGYVPPSYWEHYDVTNIVQKFIDGTTNYGFIIASDLAEGNTHRDYCSSEYTSGDSLRPKLTVTYTSNAIIPDLHSQDVGNGLRLCKNGSGIKLYVPFSGHYKISLYNVNGRKIETVSGYKKQWYQLTENRPSNGVYIINTILNGKSYTWNVLLAK